jgi:glycosyltransferase involved in cell wall biosynthesis
MKKISWFSVQNTDISGALWSSQGYTNAAVSTITSLQEKSVAVVFNDPEIPFHINFCQPYYYQLNNKYNIGYTPWESTKIPEGWHYNMNVCDEIWTTSNFVKDVYLKNGIEKDIYVIPHGISSEFKILERELTGRFNFLHIGGDAKRKNAQLVVDAFLELYDGKDDFRLILKYNKFCFAEAYVDGKLVQADQHPQILGIPDILSNDEIISLYQKCHCMVYPTSGEGFGMIPFEAMATAMPTIVTNLTGCADFAHYGIPLSAEYGDATFNSHSYATDTGDWAIPDFEELLLHMTNVVNEYDLFKMLALNSAKIIHHTHSWASVADMILNRFEQFEKNITPR